LHALNACLCTTGASVDMDLKLVCGDPLGTSSDLLLWRAKNGKTFSLFDSIQNVACAMHFNEVGGAVDGLCEHLSSAQFGGGAQQLLNGYRHKGFPFEANSTQTFRERHPEGQGECTSVTIYDHVVKNMSAHSMAACGHSAWASGHPYPDTPSAWASLDLLDKLREVGLQGSCKDGWIYTAMGRPHIEVNICAVGCDGDDGRGLLGVLKAGLTELTRAVHGDSRTAPYFEVAAAINPSTVARSWEDMFAWMSTLKLYKQKPLSRQLSREEVPSAYFALNNVGFAVANSNEQYTRTFCSTKNSHLVLHAFKDTAAAVNLNRICGDEMVRLRHLLFIIAFGCVYVLLCFLIPTASPG
jgi:hypothetical protein